MSIITEPKTYAGKDLETIFFRPIFSGPDANDLGIRILYNTPVPTTLNFWRGSTNILQKYTAGGWNGCGVSERFQKTIDLHKVKAEMGYSAAEYFSMVYELITGRADVNMDDLSGTELEEAETKLFKESIAESIRATMWFGNVDRTGGMLNTFDGFLARLSKDIAEDPNVFAANELSAEQYEACSGEEILKKAWKQAPTLLREFKNQGELVYFVSSDVYARYEESLDSATLEAAYLAKQQGRESLSYRGIPVVDIQLSGYSYMFGDVPNEFALLTDRRNLALAVNTADFPGTEVRMWYNPDQMENRQRAVFMAGCDYLLPELISFIYCSL